MTHEHRWVACPTDRQRQCADHSDPQGATKIHLRDMLIGLASLLPRCVHFTIPERLLARAWSSIEARRRLGTNHGARSVWSDLADSRQAKATHPMFSRCLPAAGAARDKLLGAVQQNRFAEVRPPSPRREPRQSNMLAGRARQALLRAGTRD
ncbi:hypothetical protein VTK73DRAFT_3985 [Phialemonium thermophilum]|uniref:Uncharacterized protein n=1 Tax=Phialemonium thermophilum TaxID=223376 RepID=A0ABR3VCR5_9PEZI